MDNIKELEITKEMYEKAKNIEDMIQKSKFLRGSKAGELFMHKIIDLSIGFATEFYCTFDKVIQEYERREKNTSKPLKELQEQDKNVYHIICNSEDILEMKYKCFACRYIENTKQAMIINRNSDSPIIGVRVIRDVERVECVERNNNLDNNKSEKWWLKLAHRSIGDYGY